MRLLRLCFLLAFLAPLHTVAAGKARYVVVVVWDGMRRDFATAQNAPTLHHLIREGVLFQNHRPVYPSTTEVNGTALATGCHPQRSHVIANVEYRPEIHPLIPVGTEVFGAVRKGDLLAGGKYIAVPTLAEIIRANGWKTAVAGAKPVALLHDRAQRKDETGGITVFEGQTLPSWFGGLLTNALGPFPEVDTAKTNLDTWTTRALVEHLWKDQVPAFSLLWLSEPDYSQHNTSPGTARSLAAIRSSDRNLARVIEALKAKGALEHTDILIVSDHGFSTIERSVDLVAVLNANGFRAVRQFRTRPAVGDVLVIGGGTVLLYVTGNDVETTGRLVHFLQAQDFTGVIFTRRLFPGTFTLKESRLESPESPDILFAMKWTAASNEDGSAGHIVFEEDGATVAARRIEMQSGKRFGNHGTLSPFDLRNTLVASGPDFRRGFVSELPSGNLDVAPTILHVLGLRPPVPMDGRVLTEALTIAGPEVGTPRTTQIEATNRLGNRVWRQYLKRTELNGVVYFNEAGGSLIAE